MNTPLEHVIYTSNSMQELEQRVKPFVETAVPLLFWGEAGAGMGFLVRMIHETSRPDGAFVRLPGFTLDEDTFLQQLTGSGEHPGWLEEARTGTLYFKRISEASAAVQKELVNLLNRQAPDGSLEFSRQGDSEKRAVRTRLLFSMPLAPDAALREQLLDRRLFNSIQTRGKVVRFPPLRERPADIPALVQNVLDEHNRTYSRMVTGVDGPGLRLLSQYRWPGNIAELKRILDAVFTQYPDISTITPAHLPERITRPPSSSTEYSFKLKHDVTFRGRILSHTLKIQSEGKHLKLATSNVAEVVRLEDTRFTPPKFEHFIFKLKDGSQFFGIPAEKTLRVATSFDTNYQIALQDVVSIDLV